jgi:predicted HicB family RNase H-like nuclease
MGCTMGRFTIVIDDKLDTEFRIEAVKQKLRLNKAFEEAMKLWLEKKHEKERPPD